MRYKKKPKKSDTTNMTIIYDDREKKPWKFIEGHWPMKKKRKVIYSC